ncbi:MAG: tetratricopeptide repeat protein, partial [Hylemonella sp.]|nr:tetratricopeptide repeat protein [Hylemonella sp.]
MSYRRLLALACLSTIASCASDNQSGSIAQLREVQVDLSDVQVEASSDKAMQSYQKFLQETPETAMTPEAMRRLADLKIQQDYGVLDSGQRSAPPAAAPATLPPPPITVRLRDQPPPANAPAPQGAARESAQAFEQRATRSEALPASTQAGAMPGGGNEQLQGNAGEAIKLYRQLLEKYPNYAHNDQVLYQLSRAYDELGMTEDAMKVMIQIARDFPASRYFDEVQFRVGENHFIRKKFLDAEDAFKAVVDKGPGSSYYELAIYKLSWTFYKQEMYEESLHRFMALLDHKLKNGYDFDQPKDALEHKRIEDTFQAISLAFSNLGGAEAMMAYFTQHGRRSYEVNLYGNLGEHYLEKRRYSDAAATYKAFVKQNPYHKVAPHYDTRVIEIYKKGGFPKLVIAANKEFVVNYGLKSEYWRHFNIQDFPEVVGYVKTSLKELANHYHALYQEKKFAKNKAENFTEAMRWYRDYLTSFPKEVETPALHYQMAELLLENRNLIEAAVEFEHTAYDYPAHDKAAQAGYTAVYAYRLSLDAETDAERKTRTTRETIRSSLKFAQTFPQHDKAAIVMGAALDDIYAMKDYALAVPTSRKLLQNFPQAEQKLR